MDQNTERRDVSVTTAVGRLFKVVNFSRKYRNTALQVAVHSPRIRFPRGESYFTFSTIIFSFTDLFQPNVRLSLYPHAFANCSHRLHTFIPQNPQVTPFRCIP